VDVPVEGIVPDTESGWLTSSFVALAVGTAGTVNAEATETVAELAEVCISAEVALSVTWSLNAYVFPAVSVLAPMLHVSIAPAIAPTPLLVPHCVAAPYAPPLTEMSHCQPYVAVPDAGTEAVTVNPWSTSRAVAVGVGAGGGVSADFAVTVEEAREV